MYLHYYNWLFRLFSPRRTWKRETEDQVIYLTFDDGPIPDVTEFVLAELKKHQAKATFFCVGDNIKKHPAVYDRLLKEGHRSGNHTFNHLKGIDVSVGKYVENVARCDEFIQDDQFQNKLFRPPYGRMTNAQERALRKEYEIIMWNVLSGDFDPKLSKEKCLEKSIKHTKKGAVVVFHDSIKTIDKLRWVLPQYLAHFSALGYRFECL